MPWLLLLLAGAVALLASRSRRADHADMADAFRLVRNAYQTIEGWARDRGTQIRAAFGLVADPLRPYTPSGPKMSAMSADAWNARKIATLAPQARLKFTAFLAEAQMVARAHGTELAIWWAVRPLEEQLEKFKQGRTAPGMVVTKTIASNHLWGMAVDLVFRSPTGQPLFNGPPGATGYPRWYYREVLPLAARHGLSSLYLRAEIDAPHIELLQGVGAKVAAAASAIRRDFPGLA